MSSEVIGGGFFDRCYRLATSPIDMIEGGLWSLWLGYQISQLRTNVQEKADAEALSDFAPQRAARIWKAKKNLFLRSVTTTSAAAFVADWIRQVGVIQFGPIQPVVVGLCYLGTAICSPVLLWDVLKEANQSMLDYEAATTVMEKQELGLRHFDMLLNVAMLTCFIGWGILGFVHSFIGGAGLFQVVDSCFFIGGILILVRLGYGFFFLPAKKQEKEPNTY